MTLFRMWEDSPWVQPVGIRVNQLGRSRWLLSDYVALVRPKHWIKNLFLFAGIVFAKKLLDSGPFLVVAQGFACFCALSSASYILNDFGDRQADRQHPLKRSRPLAGGKISPKVAGVLAVLLAGAGLGWSVSLGWNFAAVGLCYLVLNLVYTIWLKHQPVLDVISISLGFVLRAVAGVALLEGARLSSWLIVCTFCLCLFLGFGKRRSELVELGEQASQFRKVHELYTKAMLDNMLSITSGIAVVAFLMYTLDPHTMEWIGNSYLLYTTPLVLYGVFRFLLLIQSGQASGPVEVIIRDRAFQINLLGWMVACVGIIYYERIGQIWLGLW